MEDVSISVYAGARLSQVAHARQLVVVPATFGPFQVALVDELVLAGVHVDVYLPDRCTGEAPCHPSPLDDPSLGVVRILDLKGGLPVAGAKLLDVDWVLWRGEVPVARISAKGATVRRRGGALELSEARLEVPATGVVVDARRAIWDAGTRSFAIRGGYSARTGDVRSEGEGARLDLAVP